MKTDQQYGTLRAALHAVPAELRALSQWVAWRYAWEDGRSAKKRINPRTGRPASPTSPATWATFEEALAAVAAGTYDGVGFVFTPNDPYVGIDLDGCRDPETGELAPWAEEVLERFGTYAEASPSGTGVHLIVACAAPLPPRNRSERGGQKVEVYQQDRYFTVTGAAIHEAGPADRTADLLAWHAEVVGQPPARPWAPERVARPDGGAVAEDDAVLAAALSGPDAERFERLSNGQTGDYEGDRSRADQALAYFLARHTRDPDQIDRLVRRSGLSRAKWERADYRDRTIAKALDLAALPRRSPEDAGAADEADDADGALPSDVPALQALVREERRRRWAAEARASGLSRQQSATAHILRSGKLGRGLGPARAAAVVLTWWFASEESRGGRRAPRCRCR